MVVKSKNGVQIHIKVSRVRFSTAACYTCFAYLFAIDHAIVQETGIKTIPIEKKCKKAKWLSGEALGIAFWLPRALSDLVARNWGPLGMGEGSPTPTRPRLRPAPGDQVRRPDSAGTHPSV